MCDGTADPFADLDDDGLRDAIAKATSAALALKDAGDMVNARREAKQMVKMKSVLKQRMNSIPAPLTEPMPSSPPRMNKVPALERTKRQHRRNTSEPLPVDLLIKPKNLLTGEAPEYLAHSRTPEVVPMERAGSHVVTTKARLMSPGSPRAKPPLADVPELCLTEEQQEAIKDIKLCVREKARAAIKMQTNNDDEGALAIAKEISYLKYRLEELQAGRGDIELEGSIAECADIRVPDNEIALGKAIGKGAFGTVYMANWLGTEVAAKLLQTSDPLLLKMARREIEMLQLVRHPNVIQFMGVCERAEGCYLIMEYLKNGNLRSALKNTTRTITWEQRLRWAMDVVRALLYLIRFGIIHRDLKSGNVLLDSDDRVKLCDFGLARRIKPAKEEHGRRVRSMSICGTDNWKAPEILSKAAYDSNADVFSFGVVLCEMITRRDKFKRYANYAIDEGALRLSVPKDCPAGLLDLALRSCALNAIDRPPFSDILDDLITVLDLVTVEQDIPSSPPGGHAVSAPVPIAMPSSPRGAVAGTPPRSPRMGTSPMLGTSPNNLLQSSREASMVAQHSPEKGNEAEQVYRHVDRMRSKLSRGGLFRRYNRWTKPTTLMIYTVLSERRLYWKDPDAGKAKTSDHIPFAELDTVTPAYSTELFIKRGKPGREHLAFSIVATTGKSLDLECVSGADRDTWLEAFKFLVEWQGAHRQT